MWTFVIKITFYYIPLFFGKMVKTESHFFLRTLQYVLPRGRLFDQFQVKKKFANLIGLSDG
jgi:hypothetical protein